MTGLRYSLANQKRCYTYCGMVPYKETRRQCYCFLVVLFHRSPPPSWRKLRLMASPHHHERRGEKGQSCPCSLMRRRWSQESIYNQHCPCSCCPYNLSALYNEGFIFKHLCTWFFFFEIWQYVSTGVTGWGTVDHNYSRLPLTWVAKSIDPVVVV